jgi:beta-barrel assembly-enhancing protease
MRHGIVFRFVAVLTLLAVTTSCVSTQLPPISASGSGFKPLPDEQELWQKSRDEEAKLLDKVTLYEDPALESYLQGVVTRLTPKAMADNPAVHYRVRVVEDPTLNAFAYPHGSIYVHTGLLARVENEDQLATVLGHEMTHVEGRHMLRQRRAAHNKEVGFAVAAVAASVVVAAAEGDALGHGHWGDAAALDVFGNVLVGLGLELAFVASVNGYGRGLETEADNGGFAKMAASGYRLNEAPKVYEALKEDHGEQKRVEAFFFGNHPRLTERIENSKRYAGTHKASEATDPKPIDPDLFARRIRPVVRDDARLNIQIGRLKIAAAELDKARAWMPDDPITRLYIGHLRLAQAEAEKDGKAQQKLRAEAGDAFRDSVRLGPNVAGAHRDLGTFLYEEKDFKGACRELRRYTELAPEDEDADQIRDVVLRLKKGGSCK